MIFPSVEQVELWQKEWSDQYVRIKADSGAEWQRFQGKVGRVITVNFSGRALVDFADGAWYDISDFLTVLERVLDPVEQAKYNNTVNSAQKLPTRQS